ncbi:MAG: hypothetical protein E7166_03145 [Firmicutes bacterium]|nr:hypothetical protein [Bacillota bacterium]
MEFIEDLLRKRIIDLFYINEEFDEDIIEKIIEFVKKTNKFLKIKNFDLNKNNYIEYEDSNTLLRIDLILANTLMYSLNKYVNTDKFCKLMYKEYIPLINKNNLMKLFIFHKITSDLYSSRMTDVFVDYRYISGAMLNTYIAIFETIKDTFRKETVNEQSMSEYIYDAMYRGILC